MAFQLGAIPFNQSSGVGEGLNAAAQNFLRAYQMGKERRLQEQQAATQQKQAEIQTAAMQREAAMAPLREAMIRGQAFQAGIKPAEQASDTQFDLPTMPGTPGTLGLSSLPALTASRDQRYVPLGGGTLPLSQVSDATQASVPEQGGFVFDTLDNPTARARNAGAAENSARVESARETARQQLQMIYAREGLASDRQNSQNQFTASENAKNRQSAQAVAATRASQVAGGPGAPPKVVEFNQKAALVAPRAAQAAADIDRALEKQDSQTLSPVSRALRQVPILGQYLTKEDQQALQQASDVFATAMLRLESGANVPTPEMENYVKQLTPLPGDKPEVRAQKSRMREIAMERLNAAAAPVLDRERAAQSGPADQPAPRRTINQSQYNAARAKGSSDQEIALLYDIDPTVKRKQ